jgi:hypothetical protein
VGQGWHIWHISEIAGPPVPKKQTPGPGKSGSTVAEESLGGDSGPGSTVAHGDGGEGGHGCDPVKLWQATIPGDVNWDFKGELGHWTMGPLPGKLEKPTGEYLPVISYLGAPAPIPPKRELEKDPSSNQPTLPKTHEKGIRWYVQIPSHLSSSVITNTVNHLISTWGTSTGPEKPPKHQYPPTVTQSAGGAAVKPYPKPGAADVNLGDDAAVTEPSTLNPQSPPKGTPTGQPGPGANGGMGYTQ